MNEIEQKRIKQIGENLRRIQQKYFTPTSKIAQATGVHISTLTLIIKDKLDYGVSEEKLEALEKFIDERRFW